jgi:Holliday junction resolvase RusA-like endonuclease
MKITIPGDIRAKKNSQRVIRLGRRASIRTSKAYEAWEKTALAHLLYIRPELVKAYPVELHLFFYRETKRKFDLSNMIEGVQDVLQKAGVLVDDSMNHVIPVITRKSEGYGWAVDKGQPRVEIEIKGVF